MHICCSMKFPKGMTLTQQVVINLKCSLKHKYYANYFEVKWGGDLKCMKYKFGIQVGYYLSQFVVNMLNYQC
ncbi:hypothetical protein HanIR_Chr13g0620911 [Helianthus annuus]|nr:hypothetical protein HanIR_Chr13g0620911 [Helianthus annuus]